MRSDFYVADYGPNFRGWVGRTATKLVCVAPPTYAADERVADVLRELVRRHGGDCSACNACPLGRRG